MRNIRLAEILIFLGIAQGLYALFFPFSLPIIVFFTVGHALIFAGVLLYVRTVWRDLKKHKVL